ncbi:hypothetical protein F511_33161 [Dorcoceras hygrometricum]|uniref:Dystroglycan-like n=1 Tax=Dorcoceras hygrometricum TaxID=472368 RepID=A0A2Z7BWI3_9LAMI|nr:hypothetical protein F511_33161 [Dorcoceras hygrometricum]
MAFSLFVNTVHVCFESVLAMENQGIVAMFESLVATGLRGFLGCPTVIHEAALLEFFENGSVRDGLVVSTVNGVTVKISEQLLAEMFELPVEGLTDLTEIPKDLVFDARSIVSLSEETVCAVEESEPNVANEPAVESNAEEVTLTSADDVDFIINQVVTETAQIGADEEELNGGDETVSGSVIGTERPVVTPSDTDEEMETIDVGTDVGDQQLQTFDAADSRTNAAADYFVEEPTEEMETEIVEQSADEAMSLEEILMTILVDCPLPSAGVEITKITLGESISIPGAEEGDWYKTGLPKIPEDAKGKASLQEKDPVKGNPVKEQILLIIADIECLVQLREQVIDEVDKFFNSFRFKKLPLLQIEEISAKEALILSWAETDSMRVALQRRMFILMKYRELLLRKFLEARKINFAPDDGSSATDLKILDWLSDIHSFVLDELKEHMMKHGLKWDRTCCSKVFEDAARDRGVVIARSNINFPSK